jgi:hypothetical protein
MADSKRAAAEWVVDNFTDGTWMQSQVDDLAALLDAHASAEVRRVAKCGTCGGAGQYMAHHGPDDNYDAVDCHACTPSRKHCGKFGRGCGVRQEGGACVCTCPACTAQPPAPATGAERCDAGGREGR